MTASLKDLAKVILNRGRGQIVVLASYFDASWADDQKGYFVLAGFMADVDRWVVFEKDWADLLCEPKYAHLLEERSGKAYAHARKMRQWPKDIREQFYLDANYLLKQTKAFGFCHSFKQSDMKSAYEGFPFTDGKDGHYGAAFKSISAGVSTIAANMGQRVAMILERGDPGQGGAFKIYANLKKDAEKLEPEKAKDIWSITSLASADKEDWGALQAADLHAYSFFKYLESGGAPLKKGSTPKLHGDLYLLLQGLQLHFYKIGIEEFQHFRRMYPEYLQWKKEYGEKKYGKKEK